MKTPVTQSYVGVARSRKWTWNLYSCVKRDNAKWRFILFCLGKALEGGWDRKTSDRRIWKGGGVVWRENEKGVEYRSLLAYFLEHQPVALRQPKGLKFVFLLFRRSTAVSVETISGSKAIFLIINPFNYGGAFSTSNSSDTLITHNAARPYKRSNYKKNT